MTFARNASVGSLILFFIAAACASTQAASVQEATVQGAGALEAVGQEAMAQEAVGQETMIGAITHDTEGKAECLACHAPGAAPITDVTPTHEGRGNETCLWCHATDSPMLAMTPTAMPHPRATAETDCMTCHIPEANEGATDIPATHEGRVNGTCLWCHKKVEGL